MTSEPAERPVSLASVAEPGSLRSAPVEWRHALAVIAATLVSATTMPAELIAAMASSDRGELAAADGPCGEYVEQLLMDAHAIDDGQAARARQNIGDGGLVELTFAASYLDCLARASVFQGDPGGPAMDLGASATAEPPATERDALGPDALITACSPTLAAARRGLYRVTGRSLNRPAVRELARLHSANAVDCRLCRNVRVVSALDAGLTEADISAAQGGSVSGLEADAQAALAIAQAFADARLLTASEQAMVSESLSDQQASELLVELIKWRSSSVVTIAFGLEPTSDALILV